MLIYLFTFVHVVACIVLILVVLLQQGKGADWAGAFGGGGSQAAFGPRAQGNLLSRATAAAAIIFMLTSLALTITMSRPGSTSVIREDAAAPAPNAPPAAETPIEAPKDTAPQAPAEPPKQVEPEKKQP